MLSPAISSVDFSTFLKFLVTSLLVVAAAVRLVRDTASRYLTLGRLGDDAGQRELQEGAEEAGRVMAVAVNGVCFVCHRPSTKKCSRCKAVRYCSVTCQSKDWNVSHKMKCGQAATTNDANLTSTSGCRRQSRGMEHHDNTGSLLPALGICGAPKKPWKVLFPYEEFVELFNWNNPGLQPCGLLNCGNSCFANVVLQCLASTRPLVAYLLQRDHSKECSRNDWCFLCELQTHVHRVRHSLQPFSPINILSRIPNIGGNLGYGKQEDAHEFMRFAIDTMQSVCLDEFGGEGAIEPSSRETTLIHHIFGGYLQSQVICSKCNKISKRYENMMDLTVEIQGDAESLEECLNQFTIKEWLEVMLYERYMIQVHTLHEASSRLLAYGLANNTAIPSLLHSLCSKFQKHGYFGFTQNIVDFFFKKLMIKISPFEVSLYRRNSYRNGNPFQISPFIFYRMLQQSGLLMVNLLCEYYWSLFFWKHQSIAWKMKGIPSTIH